MPYVKEQGDLAQQNIHRKEEATDRERSQGTGEVKHSQDEKDFGLDLQEQTYDSMIEGPT